MADNWSIVNIKILYYFVKKKVQYEKCIFILRFAKKKKNKVNLGDAFQLSCLNQIVSFKLIINIWYKAITNMILIDWPPPPPPPQKIKIK